MVAASSVGMAKASSYDEVAMVCTPPSTAASVSMATRAILFKGCCAVRLPPKVYAKIFNFIVSGFCAP